MGSSKEPLPFFAPPPAPEEEPEHVPPAWYGPPDDVIGQAAGEGFVLARTDALALAVWGITAFPTGLAFSLAIVVRRADDPDLDPELDLDMAMHRYWRGRRRGSEPGLPDDLLRFGVEFEDGRKATSLGWGWEGAEDETAPRTDPDAVWRWRRGPQLSDGLVALAPAAWREPHVRMRVARSWNRANEARG